MSNIEKTIIDVLFLPKNHVQPYPYGCKNFNVDDKLITRLESAKEPHTEPHYEIHVDVELLTFEALTYGDSAF